MSESHAPGSQVPSSRIPFSGSQGSKFQGPGSHSGQESQEGQESWVSGPNFRLCHENEMADKDDRLS